MADQNYVTFLRELADFYEAHPLVPEVSIYRWVSGGQVWLDKTDGKEILRSIGSFNKEFSDDKLLAKKTIGGRVITFFVEREAVCTARVVGTKHVEETVVPSSYTPEQVIAAHDEDVVEWDCEPVLGPVEADSAILTDWATRSHSNAHRD
jgi:hypothetical protein